jgi:pimeloyl-ACP methyl ester carboxylesterase
VNPAHATPRRHGAVLGGLRHSYLLWDLGGPRPLVLLHGFLDQAASFSPLVAALAEGGLDGFTVAALDFRGHGRSGWIGAGGSYHFPDYVSDLHDLLVHLEGAHGCAGPTALLGHSMGGTVAGYFAGTFPERLSHLVLVEGLGPFAVPLSEGPEQMRAWIEGTRRWQGRTPRKLATVEAAAGRLRVGNHRLPAPLADALAVEGTREVPGDGVVWRFDPRHRVRSAVPFQFERLAPFLEAITAPVLLVDGADSGKLPDAPEREAILQGAKKVVIEDCGHMVHHDRPEALARAVLEHVCG